MLDALTGKYFQIQNLVLQQKKSPHFVKAHCTFTTYLNIYHTHSMQ
uniref:Uncharacterized protein n=1 Tax=Arundo donax TaxID=35708 RepID=A0A0A8Z1G9_ARUDO